VFRGAHSVSVDAKGRFAIPAFYRQALLDACGGRMVATVHQERCLLIYPQPEFQIFEQKLLSAGGMDPQVRKLQRFYIGRAHEAEMDKQGRILLPAHLREWAGLENRAVLTGMGGCFELWSETGWNREQEAATDMLAPKDDDGAIPESLKGLSF
jgi:MraZ protein